MRTEFYIKTTMLNRIIKALKNNPDGLSRTKISKLLSGKKSSKEIVNVLKRIREQNFADYKIVSTDGRPKEIWFYEQCNLLPKQRD